MTLPASGTITMAQVLTELQIAAPARTTPISLGDADVRALAGVPSGAISLASLYGKSSGFSSFLMTDRGIGFGAAWVANESSGEVGVTFRADGLITSYRSDGAGGYIGASFPGEWASPLIAGGGAAFQILLTHFSGIVASGVGGGWLSLSADRSVSLFGGTGGGANFNTSFTATIRRASDSVVVAGPANFSMSAQTINVI